MRINVQGTNYEIPNEKSSELIQWLENNSVRLNESSNPNDNLIPPQFRGQTLING